VARAASAAPRGHNPRLQRRGGRLEEGRAAEVLGIDIGGSGIKAAPADVTKGTLTRERIKVLTPQPAKPKAVAEAVRGLAAEFGWSGKAGITFPGVVTNGVIRTAANLDPSWIGVDACDLGEQEVGQVPAAAGEPASHGGPGRYAQRRRHRGRGADRRLTARGQPGRRDLSARSARRPAAPPLHRRS